MIYLRLKLLRNGAINVENYLSVKSVFSPGNQVELDFSKDIGYLKKVIATVVSLKYDDLLLTIATELYTATRSYKAIFTIP
jgi:hypothetical protein